VYPNQAKIPDHTKLDSAHLRKRWSADSTSPLHSTQFWPCCKTTPRRTKFSLVAKRSRINFLEKKYDPSKTNVAAL
jgi:hypothetical protein